MNKLSNSTMFTGNRLSGPISIQNQEFRLNTTRPVNVKTIKSFQIKSTFPVQSPLRIKTFRNNNLHESGTKDR